MLRVRPGLLGFPGDLGLKTNSNVDFSGAATLAVASVLSSVGFVGEGPKDMVGFGSSNLKVLVVVVVVTVAPVSVETVDEVVVVIGAASGVPKENPEPGADPKLKPPAVGAVVLVVLVVLVTAAAGVPKEKPPPDVKLNLAVSPAETPLFSFFGTVESRGVSQATQYRSLPWLLM